MKKIVVASFLTLITLLVTSTALSFAWYNTSDFLRIRNIEIKLKGNSDLLIGLKNSTDESDYSQEITQDQLKTVEKFKPVSSMCSNNWMKDKAQDPIFYDTYDMGKAKFVDEGPGYALPEEIPATSGFFSQELFLYSKNNYYAVLDSSTAFLPDEVKNRATAKQMAADHPEMGTEDEIFAQLNSLVNSARISVLVCHDDLYAHKIVDPYRNISSPTLLGGLLDSDLSGVYDYWTKSDTSKYEILFGEVNDRHNIIYKYNEVEPTPIPDKDKTWYYANHEYHANIIDFEASEQNGLEIATEKALSIVENTTLTEKLKNHGALTPSEKESYLYIPVTAYKPTRIVLSIYFEGWDFDNLNITMAGSFQTNIAFNVLDRGLIN